MAKHKLVIRLMILIIALAGTCFIASWSMYAEGLLISAGFLWRQAIFFLCLSVLYGGLAVFKLL